MTMRKTALALLLLSLMGIVGAQAQKNRDFAVIAYYTGDAQKIDSFEIAKLTHIIFSFTHLKDGKLTVDNARDSATIKHLVSLKGKYPHLKIMLSLGGWGGCEPCSEGFATAEKRAVFARSVRQLSDYFHTDGLDLDWEYPTIEGYPGHRFAEADKNNFTALLQSLRKAMGKKQELSFAAGGFQKYLDSSVDWKAVMPLVDRVNIMSYDLVNGYSKVTGHHTPLYSARPQDESTDRAVEYLLHLGIPPRKLVIGAAFYTRVWKNVEDINHGLYQRGEPTDGFDFKRYATDLIPARGWTYYWDEKAQAPYWYNEKEKKFATGDNIPSVKAKTQYALYKKLGGIMFWELVLDSYRNGMVQTMDAVKQGK